MRYMSTRSRNGRGVTLQVMVPSRTDLRFDGGAPWLDLLGTLGYAFHAGPAERLGARARLATFLQIAGLAPARRPAEADVAAAHALREALRRVALAVVDDRAPQRADLDVVRTWADRDAGPLALDRAPRLRRRAPRDSGEALARLARQALEDLTGPRAGELRARPQPECRQRFLGPRGRRRGRGPGVRQAVPGPRGAAALVLGAALRDEGARPGPAGAPARRPRELDRLEHALGAGGQHALAAGHDGQGVGAQERGQHVRAL